MTSFTVSFSGNTSELSASFFPEIVLDENYNYSCGLLEFTSYQSIPNITSANNSLTFVTKDLAENPPANFLEPLTDSLPEVYGSITEKNGDRSIKTLNSIRVPEGCYEAVDILEYLKAQMKLQHISFSYKVNRNTLKTGIKCSEPILCEPNSILSVLGFKLQTIPQDKWIESQNAIQISKINVLRVECSIVSGAYVNGKLCHSIYEFPSNKVDVGYKIIEQPRNIIYLPIVPRRINNIQVSIVDQNGDLVDFNGETITCRIHIKRD